MSFVCYRITQWCLRRLYRLTGGLEVLGRENIPPEGPLVVASNHASFWDPMILGAAFDRPLHFMARKTLFDVPIFGWLIRQTLAFPLNREGDSREALRAFGTLLDQSHAVLIFPEGTRTRDGALGEIKAGIGMIAVRNRVPVLPLYIWGSYQSWPRHRTIPRPHRFKVVIEPAITADPDADRKEEQKRITAEVVQSFHRLEAKAWDGEGEPPRRIASG